MKSRTLPLAGGYALLLAAAGWVAAAVVFGQFQPFDDQGYLMLTVRQLLRGHRLYDEVFTQYGPAYYLWAALLHGPLGVPLTHDAVRWTTVAVWLVAALLLSLVVLGLTGRPVLALVACTLAFVHLTGLCLDPGHPQELCLLALAVFFAAQVAAARVPRLSHVAAVVMGGACAVVLLTKVNLGVFLALGAGLGLALDAARPLGRALRALAVAAAVLLPGAVLTRHLAEPWGAGYAAVVVLGLVGLLLHADGRGTQPRDLGWLALGAAGAAAASCAYVVARGTSLHGLAEGIILVPARFAGGFSVPVPIHPQAALVAGASLAAAVALRRRRATVPAGLVAALSLVGGLVLFGLAATLDAERLLNYGPSLAWVALAGAPGDEAPGLRRARLTLCFASVLEVLQAHPMPGPQVALGTALLLPVGALCLSDGLTALDHLVDLRTGIARHAFALLGVLVIGLVGAPYARSSRTIYGWGTALGLPGTARIHASERSAAMYAWLTANLRAHCDAFYTWPGFNSLYLWTDSEPPTQLNATLWPILFDDREQRDVVDALARHARGCIVTQPQATLRTADRPGPGDGPLARYLATAFEPRGIVGRYLFAVRAGRGPTPLVYTAEWLADGAALDVPALRGNASRLAIVDLDARRTLADTAASTLRVEDETGAPVDLGGHGADLTRPRRLVLRGAVPPADRDAFVVVRVFDAGGARLASVPFLVPEPSALSYAEGRLPPPPVL